MLYAKSGANLVTATPGGVGNCPSCDAKLIAKCGPTVAHHWAHRSLDCDTWSEGTTQWHLDWQRCAPPESVEVVMGPHRADIVGPNGQVVEIQHSAISADEVREREGFYGDMIWVFDARDPFDAGRIAPRFRNKAYGFRWKHARKSILACSRPVFLDFGEQLFRIGGIRRKDNGVVYGWGNYVDRQGFRLWLGNESEFPTGDVPKRLAFRLSDEDALAVLYQELGVRYAGIS